MKDLVVYTSIFGNKNKVVENQLQGEYDLVLYTDDRSIKSKTWNVIYVDHPVSNDPVRSAKVYKILPHRFFSEYSYSVWIDGHILMKQDPWWFIHKYLTQCPLALFEHPFDGSNCIYEEFDRCLKAKNDNVETIKKQLNKYQNEGMPSKNGLWMCGIEFRRHNDDELVKFNELWWDEICTHSRRDQLSFPYLQWKHNLKMSTIPTNLYKQYFTRNGHLF
jgi:hypothetical protein